MSDAIRVTDPLAAFHAFVVAHILIRAASVVAADRSTSLAAVNRLTVERAVLLAVARRHASSSHNGFAKLTGIFVEYTPW
jgi:hypothetical protein